MNFRSSSHWCAEHIVFPTATRWYDDWEQCFEDRHNHRGLWFSAIKQYCEDHGADAVARGVLRDSNVYVGLRSRLEFEGSKHLFDHVVWVDRGDHLPEESPESMELTREDATYIINNNDTLRDLWYRTDYMLFDLGVRNVNT